MQRLGDLKPLLTDRYEKYQAQKQQTTEASAAANERIRAAREAQAREHAVNQGQRQAAKRQADENAAAVRRHQEQEQRRLQDEVRKRAAAAEEERKRAAAAEDERRREEERRRQDAERWNFGQLQASLASTSAAAQRQEKGIEYKAPARDEDEYFMPRAHPLESPRGDLDDSSSEYGGPAYLPLHHPQPQRPPPGRG